VTGNRLARDRIVPTGNKERQDIIRGDKVGRNGQRVRDRIVTVEKSSERQDGES
jgi:hypothetical protein